MPTHGIREGYAETLVDIIGCVPLLIPALGDKFDFRDIAHIADGILLTGAAAHVNPDHYGATREFEDHMLDLARDATTLPIIRHAVEMDIPLMAICRGFQEMNVVMGGTLCQHIHESPGRKDHRSNEELPMHERFYYQAHKMTSQSGGLFERAGMPTEFSVNSLHHQGIDKLGKGLHVESVADDGLIEAISVVGKRFILGVQWHPEADYKISPASRLIFESFGAAIKDKGLKKTVNG